MPEAEADLALLRAAALEAGEIALGHFRADPQVWHKDAGAGPVTEADLAVDAHLKARLTAARPGTAWLSEETEDGAARLQARDLFIVDPIDGTRAFIDGARDWAVSIALVRDGAPLAAVVHLPARNQTYSAARGRGAALNGNAIGVSAAAALRGAEILSNKASMAPSHWPRGVPEIKRVFRSSLAWRLCLVAEGRFDGMVTLRPAWHWDIAAGALIVAEAGGRVSDAAGRPLRFNTAEPLSSGTLAGGAAVHAGLLEALAP